MLTRPLTREPALVLLVLLLGFSVHRVGSSLGRTLGLDFYHFWSIPRLLRADPGRDVYPAEARAELGERLLEQTRQDPNATSRQRAAARHWKVLETNGTPFQYALLSVFSGSDYDKSYRAFPWCGILGGLLGIAMMAAALSYPMSGVLAAMLGGLWFEPFQNDLHVANVNRLQLFFLGLFLVTRRLRGRGGDLAGGFLLGVLVAFKPNTGLVPVLWLCSAWLKGRYRTLSLALRGMLAGLAASIALALACFPLSAWWSWLSVLPEALGSFYTLEQGNVSLARMASEWTPFPLPALLLGAGLATLVLLLRRAARPRSGPDPGLAAASLAPRHEAATMAAALSLSLLSSGLVWIHYLLLAVPGLLLLLAPGGARSLPRVLAGALAACLLSVRARGFGLGPLDSREVFVLQTALALLLLLVFSCREWTAAPEPLR